MKTKIAETDLGPPVIAWLQEKGADVYQEIDGKAGRADIAYRDAAGRAYGVVELKTALSLTVLDQAISWRKVAGAHYVWIGTPSTPGAFAKQVCQDYGIGLLQVLPGGCRAHVAPAFIRRADAKALARRFVPEAKNNVAGSNGGHWTPFRQTEREIERFVTSQGGRAPLKTVVVNVLHHYSSNKVFRACIISNIARGDYPRLRVESDKDRTVVYVPETKGGAA